MSAVGADWRFTVRGSPDAPTEARHDAIERLDGVLTPEALQSAMVLLTELVTNCVRHGGATDGRAIEVAASLGPTSLAMRVTSNGEPFDHTPRPPVPGEAGGMGLHLVETIASRWGICDGPPPSVCFELVREPDHQ